MKKLFVTMALAGFAASSFAQGTVGAVGYSNTGKAIYGVKASDPLAQASGDAADYSGRDKLAGTTHTAELWYQVGAGEWKAVANSQKGFATAAGAGLIRGGKTDIAGTIGGDLVNLQIRVWDNKGGTVTSWAAVLANDNVARGMSGIISNYQLGGADALNTPIVQKGLQTVGLQSFGLYIVPEPSVIALGALGLGALLLRRRK